MSRGEAETKELETRLHNQERFSLLHRIFPNDEGQFYFTEALSCKFATFVILSLLLMLNTKGLQRDVYLC
jgi:hypothetical protein